MKQLKWDSGKSRKLAQDGSRNGVSFADCAIAIAEGRVLDVLQHPTRSQQRLLILNIENYAYVVPVIVENDGSWFLKTVFPSRKHTAVYIEANKS